MRSNLHKDLQKLLDKHGCSNYFIMLIDPDSADVWTIKEGNKQWIYGELEREQNVIKNIWNQEGEEKYDES